MNLVSGHPGLLPLLVGTAATAIIFLIVSNTHTALAEIGGNRFCCGRSYVVGC